MKEPQLPENDSEISTLQIMKRAGFKMSMKDKLKLKIESIKDKFR